MKYQICTTALNTVNLYTWASVLQNQSYPFSK
ncbi:hypothetical protein V3C99_003443 [Haemonchus contortus]